jgi:hypothetical protein
MNAKWLYIFLILAAFSGGYLSSTLLADRESLEPHETQVQGAHTYGVPPQSEPMQTTDGIPAFQVQSPADHAGQFAANRASMAESKPACQCPAAEAGPSEAEPLAGPSEAELLLEPSEAELLAQAEQERAIAAELERLEREHGFDQADDIADDTVIELSEAELEDQRLALEAEIEEERESLQFDVPGNDADTDAYLVQVDGDGTGLSEAQLEDQRLAIEEAIEVEMEVLELDQRSNRTGPLERP